MLLTYNLCMLLAISKSREVILDLRMNQKCLESARGRPTIAPLRINLSCMKRKLSRIVLRTYLFRLFEKRNERIKRLLLSASRCLWCFRLVSLSGFSYDFVQCKFSINRFCRKANRRLRIFLKCHFFDQIYSKKMKKISEPKSLISSSTTRLGLSIIKNLIHFEVGFNTGS